MTNYNLRELEALERIATALEALAKAHVQGFVPALPDPHEEDRRAVEAKAQGKPYVPRA